MRKEYKKLTNRKGVSGRVDSLAQPDLYTDHRNYQMGIFKKKEKDSLIKMDQGVITIDRDSSITITGTLVTDEEKQKLITCTSSNSNISVTETKSAGEQSAAEWIWVEGYKGTDKDMKCYNDFQFTLGEEYTKDGEIIMCKNGFHFSPILKQAFGFYTPYGSNNNRFFKVKALINKNQMVKRQINTLFLPRWGSYSGEEEPEYKIVPMELTDDKLVAKSIIFLEEISTKEIFNAYFCGQCDEESDEYKENWRKYGIDYAQRYKYKKIILNSSIYSQEFKDYIKTLSSIDTLRKIAILTVENINHEVRMQMIFDDKYKI